MFYNREFGKKEIDYFFFLMVVNKNMSPRRRATQPNEDENASGQLRQIMRLFCYSSIVHAALETTRNLSGSCQSRITHTKLAGEGQFISLQDRVKKSMKV